MKPLNIIRIIKKITQTYSKQDLEVTTEINVKVNKHKMIIPDTKYQYVNVSNNSQFQHQAGPFFPNQTGYKAFPKIAKKITAVNE